MQRPGRIGLVLSGGGRGGDVRDRHRQRETYPAFWCSSLEMMLDILQHAPTAEYTSWEKGEGRREREKRWERVKLLGKRKNTTLQHVPAEQVLFNGGGRLRLLTFFFLYIFFLNHCFGHDLGT